MFPDLFIINLLWWPCFQWILNSVLGEHKIYLLFLYVQDIHKYCIWSSFLKLLLSRIFMQFIFIFTICVNMSLESKSKGICGIYFKITIYNWSCKTWSVCCLIDASLSFYMILYHLIHLQLNPIFYNFVIMQPILQYNISNWPPLL